MGKAGTFLKNRNSILFAHYQDMGPLKLVFQNLTSSQKLQFQNSYQSIKIHKFTFLSSDLEKYFNDTFFSTKIEYLYK